MSEPNKGNPFEPEHALDAENITPETPESLYDTLVWQALREAIEISEKKTDVFQLMKDWNSENRPMLNQRDLDKKVLWGLNHFDSKFKKK